MSNQNNSAEVLIVHAIDTEGPFMNLLPKFDRLNDLFNIKDIEQTKENF